MQRSRYRRIVIFFFRVLLGLALWDLVFPRIGLGKLSQRNRTRRLRKHAIGYRRMAVEMGGVLIKVGQFLSTRVDVLPVEITEELAGLQDEVPPEIFENIQIVTEEQFGMPLQEKFFTFDREPIAAASLGQAHHATLRVRRRSMKVNSPITESSGAPPKFSENDERSTPGDYDVIDVIVKVQRKDIEIIIATDIAALRTVGGWLQRYPPIKKRADIPSLLDEFTRTLYEEIDYLAEGRNAETFAANFEEFPGVLVPRVIWSHTSRRVLSLEDVRGIKINNYQEINANGISRKDVASRLLDTYLKQIFEDGFFHADPHPGNLFISPITDSDDKEWLLTFVDFGMVGRLPPNIFDGMRELLIGVGTRDPARVVAAYQMLGFLLPGADLGLIEKAEAKIFDSFWGRDMGELSQIDPSEMLEFVKEFRELLYEFPFQIPQDFIFIGRSVGILSGLCTGLDPNFNIWDHLVPFANKILAEEIHQNRDKWIDEIGNYFKLLIGLPNRIESFMNKFERGEISVRDMQLISQVNQLERAINKLTLSILFLSFLICGFILYGSGFITLSIIFFTIAVFLFLSSLIRIFL